MLSLDINHWIMVRMFNVLVMGVGSKNLPSINLCTTGTLRNRYTNSTIDLLHPHITKAYSQLRTNSYNL